MYEYCVKAVVKTWIAMCVPKADIVAQLITSYSFESKQANQLYHRCLVEMGQL